MKVIIIRKYTTLVVCSFILICFYGSVVNKLFRDKKCSNLKKDAEESNANTREHPKAGMKYILQWSSPKTVPFQHMGVGTEGFISRNCYYTNCFVTSDRTLLGDYTKFDVIAFAGPQSAYQPNYWLPKRRSPHQKYVFASIESSAYYPICSNKYDGYFNWTWTYKLDSDARWGYMIIKDEKGDIIGPNQKMNWIKIKDMRPVSPQLMKILRGKTKAVAWFVSNCETKSRREDLAVDLQRELYLNYNLTVDVYGDCSYLNCSRNNGQLCEDMIESDYHFYLSFENALSEDYVTEKLLLAVRNSAIPIVYGGADYNRFLPEGSYLDAGKYSSKQLATRIYELMHDFEQYSSYFKWRSHYSYHLKNENPETNDYCGFCAILNSEEKVKKTTIYHDFQKWWGVHPKTCMEILNRIRYRLFFRKIFKTVLYQS